MERGARLSKGAAAALCLTLTCGWSFSAIAATAADPVLDAALTIRADGCDGRPGIRADLRRDRALDAVAARWAAQGARDNLADAFSATGVRSRQSASLALTRGRPEASATALRLRLCNELTTADWSSIGWHANGSGVWIVLAIPSVAPRPEQAVAISAAALALANELRARGARCGTKVFGPAPPLKASPVLTRAAQIQADEMARYRFLAHEGRDGSTPAKRVTRVGYVWRTVGENVAAGPESAAEVMQGWAQSPEHCRNLMDPDFSEMGLAFGLNQLPTGHSTWWSQVLARPKN